MIARALLPDGRLHLCDGPINLVIGLEGPRPAVLAAREAAHAALEGVLAGLCAELPLLRAPLDGERPEAVHPVARRMVAACWPHRAGFITPMAAVAGAVADHVAEAVRQVPGLRVAHVNNGGDIAVMLAPGESLRVGLVADPAAPRADGVALLRHGDGVGGVATSGWRGRSFSLGIADAVTVLAADAAAADAAATVIANAVDAEHPGIRRRPASALDRDSDLRERTVTVDVPRLPPAVAEAALARGLAVAEALIGRGLICAACLRLQGEDRVAGAEVFRREALAR
ncbi:UPF0280 family protein [Roseococcus sp. DSY-14]|uniref:UPF0280 family protein n=1 Tax=Roseococcus sp. DSY-14 TaxID=3369650 RepID=UPI00387AE84F